MLVETIKAFFLIFIAEMGDKTQILAMAFATRYLLKEVLTGVFLGSFLNHLIAIIIGSSLSKFIDFQFMQFIAGLSFIFFGLQALKIDDSEDDDYDNKKFLSPILTVAIAFFIGELGDKTQLTAMTLSASSKFPFYILMGTVLGMVVTSSVGILIGKTLGKNIPEDIIKIMSSLIFIIFGIEKIYINLPDSLKTPTNFIILLLISILSFYFLSKPILLKLRTGYETKYKRQSKEVYDHYKNLKCTLDDICLGLDYCKKCDGPNCPIGYSKNILNSLIDSNFHNIDNDIEFKQTTKTFDMDKIKIMITEIKQIISLKTLEFDKKRLNKLESILKSISNNNKI